MLCQLPERYCAPPSSLTLSELAVGMGLTPANRPVLVAIAIPVPRTNLPWVGELCTRPGLARAVDTDRSCRLQATPSLPPMPAQRSSILQTLPQRRSGSAARWGGAARLRRCCRCPASPDARQRAAWPAFASSSSASRPHLQRTSFHHYVVSREPVTDRVLRWLPEFVRDLVQASC